MAERKRSKDGVSETEQFVDDTAAPSHQGRAEGELERQVGTRDEEKQRVGGGGATRVTKSDEEGEGNLGGHHGTGADEEE
ncbi:hypothetical protein LX81_03134 [Palleronia aestuarii]|uniref:Uncharacterized protein n=1 Tax=Palleronia aestuarii TaxID=568105 RepID=A0A2W7PW27_9RHOB|nr:hypothetical protein [Palleronia aestuarii]PZX13799.1 hypothetical protein LX81_03134 [Palleronia aestuarii]